MTNTAEHYEHVDLIAQDAGYEVMGKAGILGILLNRESLPANLLLNLTAEDVDDLYDRFIGPAVDDVQHALAERFNVTPYAHLED